MKMFDDQDVCSDNKSILKGNTSTYICDDGKSIILLLRHDNNDRQHVTMSHLSWH